MIHMEDYLNKGIKEVISKFPEIADILDEYNIGCVPCNVGTCLLKDIVQIHNLSPNEEAELMSKISNVIYPDKKVKIPTLVKKKGPGAKEIKYSPPMKRLVDEHVLIKKLLALIPEIIETLDVESEEGRQVIKESVNFVRFYADKYHHAKEEEILFKYFDENLDILKVMREDHENARSHVRAILEALDKRDKDKIIEHLKAYRELLSEHIKKEDEILYPWIDKNLSITQIGELFSKFDKVEETSDREVITRCRKFVEGLEEREQNSKGREAAK